MPTTSMFRDQDPHAKSDDASAVACKPPPVHAVPSTCQVCGEALGSRPAVHCTTCHTAHHEECRRYNRRCATYGCPSRSCAPGAAPVPAALLDGATELMLGAVDTPWGIWFPLVSVFFITGPMALALTLTPRDSFPAVIVLVSVLTMCIAKAVASITFRVVLDDSQSALELQANLGPLVFWRRPAWLPRRGVAAVNLYGEPPTTLVVVTTDGAARTVARQRPEARFQDLRAWAAAVADWADCPVIDYGSRPRPSAVELRRAGTDRLAELPSHDEGPAPTSEQGC